jgi:hypothetical protein
VKLTDPHHVTYTVIDGGVMERVSENGANYRNLSDVLGMVLSVSG